MAKAKREREREGEGNENDDNEDDAKCNGIRSLILRIMNSYSNEEGKGTLTLHQQIHNGLGYVAIVDQADVLRRVARQGRRKLQPKVVGQKLNLQWKWKWK